MRCQRACLLRVRVRDRVGVRVRVGVRDRVGDAEGRAVLRARVDAPQWHEGGALVLDLIDLDLVRGGARLRLRGGGLKKEMRPGLGLGLGLRLGLGPGLGLGLGLGGRDLLLSCARLAEGGGRCGDGGEQLTWLGSGMGLGVGSGLGLGLGLGVGVGVGAGLGVRSGC